MLFGNVGKLSNEFWPHSNIFKLAGNWGKLSISLLVQINVSSILGNAGIIFTNICIVSYTLLLQSNTFRESKYWTPSKFKICLFWTMICFLDVTSIWVVSIWLPFIAFGMLFCNQDAKLVSCIVTNWALEFVIQARIISSVNNAFITVNFSVSTVKLEHTSLKILADWY